MKTLLVVLITIGVAFGDVISDVPPEINSDNLDDKDGKDESNSICTGKDCKNDEFTCEPGETFKHYCNFCRCGPDGSLESAICTRMGCGKGWTKNGTMIIPEEQQIEISSRNKRQLKAEDRCNRKGCFCDKDGLVYCSAAGQHAEIFSLLIVGSLLVTLFSGNYQR